MDKLQVMQDILAELSTVLDDAVMERVGGKKPEMAPLGDEPEKDEDELGSRLMAASSGPADDEDMLAE